MANRSTFLTPQKKNFEAVLEKLKEQIKDVEVAQSKEVPLFWYGVAEVSRYLVFSSHISELLSV